MPEDYIPGSTTYEKRPKLQATCPRDNISRSSARVLGDDDAQVHNSERRQVLDVLREDGGLSPAQIAAELGKARPAVRMLLKRMKDDMQVKKQGTKYVLMRSENYSAAEND